MAIAPGTLFGHYEIIAAIGAGGMGEVYRAKDTTLKRDVALKILPQTFSADADRVARFQREAEALAALNHPNIAQVYGLERSDGSTAIVMELIEGPTLADLIAQGPIPYDDALGIANQIIAALEAAHGKSIVHRDLKPANIKVRTDGTVKVLDFGIATAPESPLATSGKRSPALLTPALTKAGILLGTAGYMSPEQARGRPVDERADIWAFGCVLYEMLTGQPAFTGEDVTTTLARVLEREASLSALPAAVPARVHHTIELCLEKDPSKRIADIRDVKHALEGRFGAGARAEAGPSAATRSAWQRVAVPGAAALVGVAAAALVAWTLWPEPPRLPTNRFSYAVPEDQPFRAQAVGFMDVSRDGRSLVYNSERGLYLRAMNELEARLVPGTDIPMAAPLFSPDGQSLVYRTETQLMRIPVSGGAPVVITTSNGVPLGASWEEDDTILFGQLEGILRVPATGGTAELVIPARDGEVFLSPRLLPDGDSVLFTVGAGGGPGVADWDTAQIVAESLSTHERTLLVSGGADARYLPTGHLVYAIGNDLFGVVFEAQRRAVVGGSVPLVQGVSRAQTGGASYAVSDDGTLVYVRGTGQDAGSESLVWVDRNGREEPVGLPSRNFDIPRVSRDGRRIGVGICDRSVCDIWVSDVGRPVLSRITSTPESDFFPLWTPDGNRILFTQRGSQVGLAWALADGTGVPEPLLTVDGASLVSAEGWSADGEELVLTYATTPDPRIGVLSMTPDSDGERAFRPLLDRATDASGVAMSPDGAWIAYQSDSSGAYAVYIERYPELGNRQVVSTEPGGWAPLWSHDGRELYYRRLGDGAMMAVSIETSPSLSIGTPEVLFENQGYAPLTTPRPNSGASRPWDVAPDGRFLMIKAFSDAGPREIIIVENWLEEVKRLAPTE